MSNPITSVLVNSLTSVTVTYANGNKFEHSSPYDLKQNNPEAVPLVDAALKDYDAQRSAQLADQNAAIAKHVDVLTSHRDKLPKEIQASLDALALPHKERKRAALDAKRAALDVEIAKLK